MSRAIVVGTAGHVDHGKTALVRALTGVETDRWAAEQERGLTIDIGFASLPTPGGTEAGLVDVPGHEDFVKNMLAGCTGLDVLLLVVAADEGPMPQTSEHLLIARLLGVTEGVVALNKVDNVDDEWLALAREATREELVRTLGHDRWPILEVSARTGEGLGPLVAEIEQAGRRSRPRDRHDLFRMPVDRGFTVKGAGTVATGTTWSGEVRSGDRVRLLPADLVARVRSLEVHGSQTTAVGPGRRCAMALVGIDVEDAERGNVIVSDDAWRRSSHLGVRIEVPAAAGRAIEHGQRVRLYLGTREVMARMRTFDRRPIHPGHAGWGVLYCEDEVVARVRDRFVLRFYSPVTTVGGGTVCRLEPPRTWRREAERWEVLISGSDHEAVLEALRLAGGKGVREVELPLVTGLSPGVVSRSLAGHDEAVCVGGTWYASEAVGTAAESVVSHLREAHSRKRRVSTIPLESLRAGLASRYSPDLLGRVVDGLVRDGTLSVDGPGVRLVEHEVELRPEEARAERLLLDVLGSAGLAPPDPAELSANLDVDRDLLNDLLGLLLEKGEIVRVSPEIFVTRAEEERATKIVREIAKEGPSSPGSFRAALGLTRKHLIPLLEHMDRRGVTRRTAEGRIAGDA